MRHFAALALLTLTACGTGRPAASAAPAPAGPPTNFRYQPDTVRYRGVQHRHVEQEFQGQVTSNDQVSRYVLTAVIAGDSAPYQVSLSLDTLALTGASGVTPAEVEAAREAQFTGTMASTGRLRAFLASDTTEPLIMRFASSLRDFFPIIPAAGAEPGMRWADTSSRSVTQDGLELTVHATAQYESLEWTDYEGLRALEIRTVSEYTLSGAGEQAGQALELDGTGSRHAHEYLADNGWFVGSVTADTTDIEVFLTNLGVVVPVTQWSADTLRLVQ